ncbi:MAG TPA: MIP/aquaporin family protein [Longimicrobiales bacterium]|nr:MIP/aquaporin family protein [Longimicrobiales bacterium]
MTAEHLMKRYLTEAIGTFFLVFAIGMSVTSDLAAAPLAIGSMLMVMVYMGGHVSGAHYNPAVTVAVLMSGGMSSRDVVPYIGVQLLGAWLAAGTVYVITGATFAPAPAIDARLGSALLAEVLVTFALVLVILNVATAEATKGNSYYGLAIGFTVAAGAWTVGPVSGGAFNPAVGIGPIMVDSLSGVGGFGNLWLYLVGPLIGSIAAVPVFKIQTAVADDRAVQPDVS